MIRFSSSPARFLWFVFGQIMLSLLIIIIFQQSFHLSPKVLVGHLMVVSGIHVAIVALGMWVFSSQKARALRLTSFVLSLCYGCLAIILYLTYLLAFYGKIYHSRIFTFEIFWGYFQHLHAVIRSVSANFVLVYAGLFGVPALLLLLSFRLRGFIHRAFPQFRQFVQRHHFQSPPKTIQRNLIGFLLGVGFVAGILIAKQETLFPSLYVMEEPLVSVFGKEPIQGQMLFQDAMEAEVRNQYPKGLDFEKKNVILIVVDALRSDHLSLFGYERETSPFLDSLYRNGSLQKMDLAFSASAGSFGGINGILRSKIWANMGYHNFSLQRLLKDQGYGLNFFISGDHTHFYGLKSFYGGNTDFDFYLDGSSTKEYAVNDDRLIFEGLQQIPPYQNDPAYFHFHLNSAHASGRKLEKYQQFTPASSHSREIKLYINSYDNGILQADDYVRRIFEQLEEKGYLENSLVVITADHGEALGERGVFGHAKHVYTDHLLIPILIVDSDPVSCPTTRFASSLDIAPSIVDRLGLPIPESWEGNSWFREPTNAYSYHQMGDTYAIIHQRDSLLLKYVFTHRSKKEELFDLSADLYEQHNLIDSAEAAILQPFRNRLAKFRLPPD